MSPLLGVSSQVRSTIISMILGTDMQRHFDILGQFTTKLEPLPRAQQSAFRAVIQEIGLAIPTSSGGRATTPPAPNSAELPSFLDEETTMEPDVGAALDDSKRALVLQMVRHLRAPVISPCQRLSTLLCHARMTRC